MPDAASPAATRLSPHGTNPAPHASPPKATAAPTASPLSRATDSACKKPKLRSLNGEGMVAFVQRK